MSDHTGQETHAVVQAGVGIFFQQDAGGFVVVKSIVKGGSAERDGTVQIGDRILSVDDRSVAGESLPVLRSLILGPQGSAVKMKFARQSSHVSAQEFSISLIRGTSEYFSEKDSSFRQQRALTANAKPALGFQGSSGTNEGFVLAQHRALVAPKQLDLDFDAETTLQLPDGHSIAACEIEKNILIALPCLDHAFVFGSKRSFLAALIVLKTSNGKDPNFPLSSEGLSLAAKYDSSAATIR